MLDARDFLFVTLLCTLVWWLIPPQAVRAKRIFFLLFSCFVLFLVSPPALFLASLMTLGGCASAHLAFKKQSDTVAYLGIGAMTIFLVYIRLALPATEYDLPVAVGISYLWGKLAWAVLAAAGGSQEDARPLNILTAALAYPTYSSGPIDKPSMFSDAALRQPFSLSALGEGGRRIALGLFKLLLISNEILAPWLKAHVAVYSPEMQYTMGFYWLYAVFVLVNLYCNFSGYVDIGIGAMRLLNIRVSENFDFPFIARSVPEYWRRWHITLGNMLRDLVFYPATYLFRGNAYLGIITTFVVVGLWHGLSLPWLLFGLGHGCGVAAGMFMGAKMKKGAARKKIRSSKIYAFGGWLLTFLWISFLTAIPFSSGADEPWHFMYHCFGL